MWLQLFLWIASFVISDYFRERLPAQTASGIGDFNIPTATEGRVVPIILGGTVRVEAPNCVWYGDFAAVERTVTTGVIFKREETIGFTYELALQYALFKGEGYGITGIWIGDDQVFDHVTDAGGVPQAFVDVDRDDLFGGPDNGGGFQGRVRLHNGSDTQAASAYLATKGLDPLPAYRGTCYVMITNLGMLKRTGWLLETVAAETRGANIGESNNLRYIRVEVQTFSTVVQGGLGDTMLLGNDHHFIGPDANPMDVAYKLYVNNRWGRSFPPSDVNLTNFKAAAETVWAEGIGFTMLIDEQTTSSEIQDAIEQHCDCYIGPNPLTGQIEVTLSRADYTIGAEYQANASNILAVKKWSQGDWSQTFNRVRIRYTDRAKNWKETHAIELAAGNRIIQGTTKTKEMRFQGVHTAAVASKIAARTKRQVAQPAAQGQLELDRTAYLKRPGDIISLTSEKAGNAVNLPVRITKTQVGDTLRNSIVVDVVQDIDGTELATQAVPPASDFVPPVQAVIPFATLDQGAFELPRLLALYSDEPNPYPRIATLARRGAGNEPTEYQVIRRTAAGTPTGAWTLTDEVKSGFMAVGTLRNNEAAGQAGQGTLSIQVDPIGAESLDALIGSYDPNSASPAGIAVLAPGTANEEWILFGAAVDSGTGIQLNNVYRSAIDSTWKTHAAGDRVWFIWTGGLGLGPEIYTENWNVEIKLLPISPNDAILEAEATSLPLLKMQSTTDPRATKPLLPSVLNINAADFPTTIDFDTAVAPGGTPANFNGVDVLPTHRTWRNDDVKQSVQGLDVGGIAMDGVTFTADAMRVSAWLHNLDLFPAASRTNALLTITDQVVPFNTNTSPYSLYFDRAAILALEQFDGQPIQLGGNFSGRLEIETKHTVAGQTANNLSQSPMFHDFVGTGAFPPLASEPILSLHFDGANTDTFTDDASPANWFVEFNGGAQISTAQSVFGGSSLALNGTDAFLRTPNRPGLNINDEWTIEFRAYFTADPVGSVTVIGQMDGGSDNSWAIHYDGSVNQWRFNYSTTGLNDLVVAPHTGTWAPTAATWYAIAITRKGTAWRVYVDGVPISASVTSNPLPLLSSCDWIIGARNFTGILARQFDGYLDEIRVTPRRIYDGTYTVETIAHADAGALDTVLLAHMDGTNLDTTYPTEDLTGFTLTAANTSEVDTSQFKFGSASLRCDGVNTSTTVSDGWIISETVGARHPAFDFKTDDFFMDCHVKFNALPTGDGAALIAKYARTIGDGADWMWYINPTNGMVYQYWLSGQIASSAGSTTQPLGVTLATGVWYHFAIERSGNNLNMYFDGNRIYQGVDFFATYPYVLNGRQSGATYFARPVTIGRFYSVGSVSRMRALNGWIDEVRIAKRALINAATYVVPTTAATDPLRVLNDTESDPVIILSGFENVDAYATDRAMTDESNQANLIVFGNQAQIDTANFKFGSSSVLFDGGADYVEFPTSVMRHQLKGFDFTIDLWADLDILPQNSGNGGMCLVSDWYDQAALDRRGFRFFLRDTGASSDLVFQWTTDGTLADIREAFVLDYVPTINTWTHFAVCRVSGVLYLFVDGVLQTLDAASDVIGADVIFDHPTQRLTLGLTGSANPNDLDFDGHMDEVRIKRGGDWTTSFTPATAPYPRPSLPYF